MRNDLKSISIIILMLQSKLCTIYMYICIENAYKKMVNYQSFLGDGLRYTGVITREILEAISESDAIHCEEFGKACLD